MILHPSADGLGCRGFLQKASNRLGRLGAAADPILCPLSVNHDFGRLTARVVMTQDFYEAAVTSLLPIDDDYPETSLLLGSCASQPYPQQSPPLTQGFLNLLPEYASG
jgi:hypothetical protein